MADKEPETLPSRARQDLRNSLSAAELEYLDALLRVLEDQKLTKAEHDYAVSVARLNGLSQEDRRRVHVAYLDQMSLELMVKESEPEDTLRQLETIARLLGLNAEAASRSLTSRREIVESVVTHWLSVPDKKSSTSTISALYAPVQAFGRLGAVTASIGGAIGSSIAGLTRVVSTSHQLPCKKCKKETPHSVRLGKDFPVADWLRVFWNAKSFSPTGFVSNAAMVAVADKKLMQKTGKSLIPEMTCDACQTPADPWHVARMIIKIFPAHEPP